MAEWTKFEDGLPGKREVIAIARKVRLNPEQVACRLMAVWAWARRNSVDGVVADVMLDDIDQQAGRKGFGKAMKEVAWVTDSNESLTFPNWERHNSNGAKARAQDARRKEDGRRSANCPVARRTQSGQMSGSAPEKIGTRQDKTREETDRQTRPEVGRSVNSHNPIGPERPLPDPKLAARSFEILIGHGVNREVAMELADAGIKPTQVNREWEAVNNPRCKNKPAALVARLRKILEAEAN